MNRKKLKIVKIGGEILDSQHELEKALDSFAQLQGNKILIHGGGKEATRLSVKMGIEPQVIDGRRVTSSKDLEIVTMVYAGLINKRVVAYLQSSGCNSIGLAGVDGNSILSEKRKKINIDYGWVGDVVEVNSTLINILLEQNITPVFSAITHDKKGNLLNTNADTVASEIAIAMSNEFDTELLLCFDKPGLMTDISNSNSIIPKINFNIYNQYIENGIIKDGMIPKLKNGFNALENHVNRVIIGDYHIIKKNCTVFTELFI